jgi:hypothetical protein
MKIFELSSLGMTAPLTEIRTLFPKPDSAHTRGCARFVTYSTSSTSSGPPP